MIWNESTHIPTRLVGLNKLVSLHSFVYAALALRSAPLGSTP